MSLRVLTTVWTFSTAKHSSLLVLLAMADSAHDDGVCFPHLDTIATKARVSEKQLQRVLGQLVESGELERRTWKSGRRRGHAYRVLLGKPLPVDYDRLPGQIDEPFTERHIVAPSESTAGHLVPDGETFRPLPYKEDPSGPVNTSPAARAALIERLEHHFGKPSNRSSGRAFGVALSSLAESSVTAEELDHLIAEYSRTFTTPCTPHALAKHVDRLRKQLAGAPAEVRCTVPECGLPFRSEQRMREHLHNVHGIDE